MSEIDGAAPVRNEDTGAGFLMALAAYVIWGFLPLYMKAIAHVSPAEVLSHRVLWSLPFAGAVLLIMGRTADLKAALRSPRTLLMASLTAALISINWGTYVWAIGAGRALDTALGYFINPLFSIFLASVLLKEKLRRTQLAAIGLAALAVVILTVEAGALPWVSLILTFSWGFYAFFRKTLPVGPNQGFFLEVLLLSIPAALIVGYLEWNGTGHIGHGSTSDIVLLVLSGVITAGPLMIYANAAKRLRLSTIGIMQYIAPTMIFLIAVFVFHEPFGTARMIAFPLIWAALAVYSWPMITDILRRRRMAAKATV